MKVKEIVNKIRLIGTEVEIKECGKTMTTLKTPIKENDYINRTIASFEPTGNKQMIIHIMPLK